MKARNKFSKIDRVRKGDFEDSLTQEHFKDDVDINRILAKYRKTGIPPHVKRAQEVYGDFTQYNGYDLASHMDKVAKAQQSFEMLPAELRDKFQNSIPGFFKYVNDPKNIDDAIAWGVKSKPAPAAGAATGEGTPSPNPQSNRDGSLKKPKATPPPAATEGED